MVEPGGFEPPSCRRAAGFSASKLSFCCHSLCFRDTAFDGSSSKGQDSVNNLEISLRCGESTCVRLVDFFKKVMYKP